MDVYFTEFVTQYRAAHSRAGLSRDPEDRELGGSRVELRDGATVSISGCLEGRRYPLRDPLRAVHRSPAPGLRGRSARAVVPAVRATRSPTTSAPDPAVPRALADPAAGPRRVRAPGHDRVHLRPAHGLPVQLLSISQRVLRRVRRLAAGADVPDEVLRRADAGPRRPRDPAARRPCRASTTCSAAPVPPCSRSARSPRSRAASCAASSSGCSARCATASTDIVELTPTVAGIEYSPQFAQVAGAADVMVVATFDLRINERSYRMTICLPFSGLQPHLLKAAAPAPVSDRERAQRAHAADAGPAPLRGGPGRGHRPVPGHPARPRHAQQPRRRRRAAPRAPRLRPARRHRRRQDLRPRHRRCAGPPPRRPHRGHTEGEPMTTEQITPRQSELAVAAAAAAAQVLPSVGAADHRRRPAGHRARDQHLRRCRDRRPRAGRPRPGRRAGRRRPGRGARLQPARRARPGRRHPARARRRRRRARHHRRRRPRRRAEPGRRRPRPVHRRPAARHRLRRRRPDHRRRARPSPSEAAAGAASPPPRPGRSPPPARSPRPPRPWRCPRARAASRCCTASTWRSPSSSAAPG